MRVHITQLLGVLSVVVSTLLFFSVSAFAATYYVPDDFGTIQAALDGAGEGDEIIVRDGTYTGAGNKNLDFLGKALTLRSENGPENCIIDCEQSGRGFYLHSNETQASVIDGFMVTNGLVYAEYGEDGGGIYLSGSSPTISNCIISNNSAYPGSGRAYHRAGGIFSDELSSPKISDCAITGNISFGWALVAGKNLVPNPAAGITAFISTRI